MKPARFIISWAQDCTPVHRDFFASMQTYARHRRAEIIVVAGMYKNPTSRFDHQFDAGEYAEEVLPHLCHDRRQLAPNLCLYGEVRVQPTALRPLTGLEVFCAGNSGIFGHPKRALDAVPTATRLPRLLMTTSACTVDNYSTTKAGQRGRAHHVLGALVVDIDAKGYYYPRHISWDSRTKSFTDIDRRYYADRHEAAPPAASLTFGDIHVGRESKDGLAEKAAKALFLATRPQHLVLHDVLDFATRNHHNRSFRARFAGAGKSVQAEVAKACEAVADFAGWGDGTHLTHVVRSNHDEALERFLEEFRPLEDPENAPYWHYLSWKQLRTHERSGAYPDLFAMEFARFCPDEQVHFLKRDEPLRIKGVEGGFHTDKGINGSRGSPQQYSKLGCKVTGGHTHTGRIVDGYYGTGVYGSLDHGYNGLPSTWTNSDVLLLADGKRQLLIRIAGKFRA